MNIGLLFVPSLCVSFGCVSFPNTFSMASLIHPHPPKGEENQLLSASNRQSLDHFRSRDLLSMGRVQDVTHRKSPTWMAYKSLKGRIFKSELLIAPHLPIQSPEAKH